jgi:hypothetical protein
MHAWKLPEFDKRKDDCKNKAADENKEADLMWQEIFQLKNINTEKYKQIGKIVGK